ncbi:MAG: bifunctional riboflavin kinase/FAD synthetase [Weeksellaceae bacterium]|nr:bifunctional riboflavin kinase/FAD synthetase [Weeksellaceae bacterium]
MKIFEKISDCKGIKKPVLTLGTFDGLHIGHQSILKKLNQIANEVNGESVLLTFEPHPRIVLNKSPESLQMLTTLSEKIKFLENYGLQNLILHPFTQKFSELSATDFVKKLLVDEIGIHTIIIGYDHHFGKGREGNYELLHQLSKEYGFNCIQIEEVKSNNAHISSTQIRKALSEGKIEYANQGLNRNYSLTGKVIHGDKLGRTLGFPTANLETEQYKLLPENGVYMSKLYRQGKTYKALTSIGTRPTITHSGEKRVETFVLDFDEAIYGELIEIEFLHKIRDDKKFDSLDELVQQMNKDKDFAEKFHL